MSNKILLACMGKKLTTICTLKITIGSSGDSFGYLGYTSGSCEVLSGSFGEIFALYHSGGLTILMSSFLDSAGVQIANVTTGITMKSVQIETQGVFHSYYFVGNLFNGMQVGQSCIVEIRI